MLLAPHTNIAPNVLQPAHFLTHIIPAHSKSYDINDLKDKRLSSPQTYVVNVVYVVKQTCRHSSGVGVAFGLDSHDPLDRGRIVEKVRLVTDADLDHASCERIPQFNSLVLSLTRVTGSR
jgi:hypothetical protein